MPFFGMSRLPAKEVAPGVEVQAFSGKKMTLTLFTMTPGSEVPGHAHPHEQMGTVLKGAIELFIGDEKRVVRPGDCWLIPSNVVHRGVCLDETSELLEFFSPCREDYAPAFK